MLPHRIVQTNRSFYAYQLHFFEFQPNLKLWASSFLPKINIISLICLKSFVFPAQPYFLLWKIKPSMIDYNQSSKISNILRNFFQSQWSQLDFNLRIQTSNFNLIQDNMNQSGFRDTVLRQSYVFNTGTNSNVNRSFISTAIVNDSLAYGDDLRKSRIQNLPNYKKTNLGENIQFIVVFQTIEIQRLSQEIQVLRVRIKEYERQLFNAQNYEVQIRELTEKCFAQEKQIYQYRQQYEKLNKICQTLYHENQMLKNKLNDMDFSLKQKYEAEKSKNSELTQEIQKWKSRYQASQKSKAKELQDLRNMMESQRKSMIDREIREMTIRFQNERSALQNQIRKCRELLDNRNREIDDYKQKCQKYEITIMELRNYENIISDHENKLALLNQELIRLNEILRDKNEENAAYRQRQQKLNQQIKEQRQWQFQSKQLKSSLQTKIREAEEWKARASRLEEEVVRGKQLEHYNQQLGNKLNLASKQLERLNGILRNKLEQIQQWKKKVTDREGELSKFKNLENQLYNYQSKIGNLKIQNDRINGILKSRLGEIQDWKGRYNSLQQTLNNFSNIQKQKKGLQDRCSSQIRQNQQLKHLISKLQNDISGYRKNENQLKDIQRNNMNLTKQIQRLNNLLKNQSGELNDYRIRYNKIQSTLSQYKTVELKVRDYENKINLLTTELQKLNDLLKDRNKEISALQKQKLELYSKINYYKNYEIKITQNEQIVSKMQESNNNLKRQIDNWQQKYRQAENKARQFQNHLFKNNQEKEKLSNMVKNKNAEYDELRIQYSRLQPQVRKKNEIEISYQEQQNHIVGLMSDLQGYERKLKTHQQELQKQKAFTNEFAFKIIVLSSQIQRLNSEGAIMSKNKSKEFIQLQESYSKLQSKVQSKNNEIDMLINKITSLENKINQITTDFNRILTEVQKSQQQTRSLTRQIEEYQDYARRIHILGAEIDRLRTQNKAFDQDIKKMRLKYADSINAQKKEEAISLRTILMAAEIQSLRRRIDQREINVQQLRKSILEPVRRI